MRHDRLRAVVFTVSCQSIQGIFLNTDTVFVACFTFFIRYWYNEFPSRSLTLYSQLGVANAAFKKVCLQVAFRLKLVKAIG